MKELHIPPLINYSCICCGRCCRSLGIVFSEKERETLDKQNWGKLVPRLKDVKLFRKTRSLSGPSDYRVYLQADGACAFLDRENRCLVHSHLGFNKKPFACKIFPFTFAFTPLGVHIGCRFNCPAIIKGEGKPAAARKEDLRRLIRGYARGRDTDVNETVDFNSVHTIDWRDALEIEEALIAILSNGELDLLKRIVLATRILAQLDEANLDKIKGETLRDLLEMVIPHFTQEIANETLERPKLKLFERIFFNQLVAFFCKRTPNTFYQLPLIKRLGVRLRSLLMGFKFMFQVGSVRIGDLPRAVKFKETKEVSSSHLDPSSEELLRRYLITKIHGQNFFDMLFFDYNFVTGFNFLIATYSVILWTARASAAANGVDSVRREDVETAVEFVDYNYGYLNTLGGPSARMIALYLALKNTAARLAVYFSQPRENGDPDAAL